MARIDSSILAFTSGAASAPAEFALKPMNPDLGVRAAPTPSRPLRLRQDHLAQHHLGLVSSPSRGRVLFDGRDVAHLPTEKRNIAQVFQLPVVYDTMTA